MLESKPKKSAGENKLAEKIRLGLFSPTFNIIALVMLLLSVFGGLRILERSNTQAQIKFVESRISEEFENEKGDKRNVSPPDIFHGEVYDTSIRLRETGALGMAISLAVFGKVSEQGSVPINLETVWDFINRRNLMPPGLEFNDGELSSSTSIFILRFQSKPFRFEILASPKQANTSPAIMMRFPLQTFDGRSVSYLQSPSTKAFEIPSAFTSLEKVLASGWTIEQWRGELLPKNGNSLNILEEEKRLLKKMPKNR
jgi:hypothetical protein